jgi:hypothetical protein
MNSISAVAAVIYSGVGLLRSFAAANPVAAAACVAALAGVSAFGGYMIYIDHRHLGSRLSREENEENGGPTAAGAAAEHGDGKQCGTPADESLSHTQSTDNSEEWESSESESSDEFLPLYVVRPLAGRPDILELVDDDPFKQQTAADGPEEGAQTLAYRRETFEFVDDDSFEQQTGGNEPVGDENVPAGEMGGAATGTVDISTGVAGDVAIPVTEDIHIPVIEGITVENNAPTADGSAAADSIPMVGGSTAAGSIPVAGGSTAGGGKVPPAGASVQSGTAISTAIIVEDDEAGDFVAAGGNNRSQLIAVGEPVYESMPTGGVENPETEEVADRRPLLPLPDLAWNRSSS